MTVPKAMHILKISSSRNTDLRDLGAKKLAKQVCIYTMNIDKLSSGWLRGIIITARLASQPTLANFDLK